MTEPAPHIDFANLPATGERHSGRRVRHRASQHDQRPVDGLDLATVIKVSQALSGEIVLERMLDTLMRTALEHAGAEQGLLIRAREVVAAGMRVPGLASSQIPAALRLVGVTRRRRCAGSRNRPSPGGNGRSTQARS